MADRDYKKPDFYADRAKKDGYAARSVFKLKEIDADEGLLQKGRRVLDLGAAPGSWMQYSSERVGAQGLVVGIDLKAMERNLRPNERYLQGDVHKLTVEQLREFSDRFDLVLSDMMPNTIGHKASDHLRSMALAERALELAELFLRPGGAFLVKVFQGAEFESYRNEMRRRFDKVKIKKPKSSRKMSREIYLLGIGKKGEQGHGQQSQGEEHE